MVRVRLTRIQDSCGYGVPLYDFVKPRDTLLKWAERKGENLRPFALDLCGRAYAATCRSEARSNRSAFITLVHAATKSCTNFSCESAQA